MNIGALLVIFNVISWKRLFVYKPKFSFFDDEGHFHWKGLLFHLQSGMGVFHPNVYWKDIEYMPRASGTKIASRSMVVLLT